MPDRFDKAHQPEDVHAGDVLFLGDADVALGKLPVPTAVKEKADRERAERERAAVPAAAGEPVAGAALKAPAEPTGFDLDVHVAPGSRLFFSPIDVTTGGDLRVEIRPEGRKIRGKLAMTKGELSLGGKMHPLKQGSWVFDDAHPSGEVDLTFERQLPPWALRDVSEASAGTSLRIHMAGPVTDRKTVLSGAGSPGTLFDLLSMHNVGRERFYSEADLPESVAVEFPQHSGLLALSFISVNLPHLLFLDRVAAWADSFDGPRAYGRLEHYEAERYFADGKGRVRAAKRPAGIGRSEAELEVDYLFMNEPRVLFGVGATGGSRGGGGPSVVLEWSSKD
ncbi:MAG: translocation/assembly module TamB domain-containing protein [Polyangiaceae bacterium]|nr:translocation/assembly module TamB domain-containing protein [Polyangiaceae bacterium]